MSLVVLLGGARSGKSMLALRLAAESGAAVTVVATGEALDEEMAARIAAHRAERPPEWTVVEEPLELAAAIEAVPARETLVVDCLSLWVANTLERGAGDVEQESVAAADAAAARAAPTIAVTNEVGLGIVPDNALARSYRDTLGRVNADWAALADEAYFVVAGRPLRLE
jgi:adenosylcobinamide kinase/adenosylcobinamide-phosphate guanylyltransferase